MSVRIALLGAVLSWALQVSLFAQSTTETIEIATYYPAPYGSYAELTTTNNTYLATEGGNVGIGTTAPGAKLEVNGGVKIGDDGTCHSAKAGTMRYRSSQGGVLYCDGSRWTSRPVDCEIADGGVGTGPRSASCSSGFYVVSGYCTGTEEHVTQISLDDNRVECTDNYGSGGLVHPHAVCCR